MEQAKVVPLETNAGAVGGDTEIISGAVGAVHLHGIIVRPALHQVRTVAVVPNEQVVAILAELHIVAPAADQRIIAGPAAQRVDAIAADQQIVALSAVEIQFDQAHKARRTGDHIAAALAVDVQIFDRPDIQLEQAKVVPLKTNAGAVGRNAEVVPGAVGAVDLHRIVVRAAFHQIRAVPVVPDEQVVPLLAELNVVAAATDQRIVACPTTQRIHTVATDQEVIALPTVKVQLD